LTGKFEKSEKEPLMDSNRLERKKRIERNRKRRLYRNVNNLMYAGIFVMAAIITIAAAVSRNNKIEYVDTAQMASTESIRVNNSNTDKVAAKAEETTKKSKKKVVTTEEAVESTTSAESETTTEPETTTTGENNLELGGRIKITADTLYVREEASADGSVLGMASTGDEFYVLGKEGDWVLVNYQGNDGYIKAEFAQSAD
jgi:cytoskeletal protein RodZ